MIIEIKNLHKSFKDVKAVDGVSFKVKEGELFAFLGVNGAGKSTTINIISGILKKDEGSVNICGYNMETDADKIKNELGIVFQNSVLDKKMSVYDNLKSRAAMYWIYGEAFKNRLNEICELFDLKELLKRPLNKLSGGQKRRIDIARALFHRPKLLILDEPTTGLDPKTRIMVWDIVNKLRREQGLTVFLTTHYMEEAADADYVVILDGGKKAAEGTPHDLKSKYANDFVRIYGDINFYEGVLQNRQIQSVKKKDYIEIELTNTEEATKLICENPDVFKDYEVLKGNMDNVFLKVTGKDLSEV